MKPCVRGAAPPVIAAHGAAIGAAYAEAKRRNPRHTFSWPTIDGARVDVEARAALAAMTDERCAYCDGYPIDATGEAQIDHFRPKSRPEFYELVCSWENLFLSCVACNKAKQDRWSELLLRPDAPGFSFERYFAYDVRTDRLLVNEVACVDDQARAAHTIETFRLNRDDLRSARALVRRLLRTVSDEDLAETGFRYLQSVVHP